MSWEELSKDLGVENVKENVIKNGMGKRKNSLVFKSRCQGKPYKLESGGLADHLGTNFFGLPIKNCPFSRVSSSSNLTLAKIRDF